MASSQTSISLLFFRKTRALETVFNTDLTTLHTPRGAIVEEEEELSSALLQMKVLEVPADESARAVFGTIADESARVVFGTIDSVRSVFGTIADDSLELSSNH
ncbi:hypothetical protein Pyn_20896 [Prunus yedoensis var. nudiflora]|uniref:Uncharacterized protein n=1 Tax=Prunus yedoensis var. nudiflora TaxID=2094558 RepID=A0A314UW88_PRUYE|nr:hypothetical protein Pyn_20896 [Prunus yedoensis var. nudiflora]